MSEKAEQLKDSLKIAVKRRGNLRRMFTNESKKLAPIFDKADKAAEIVEDDIEKLKASQQKLLDARPEMRQLDKEIQNTHVLLGEEDTADQDFVDADNISDTHTALLREIEKLVRRDQQLQSSKSIPQADSGVSKQLKHSALKLPKMSLPVFDGDRRKWLSFWDVFKSEVQDPQHTASALRTFYDRLMSDMRSLATLDLPKTRYGDFYVPILLEKLPEKLLTNVLKEYPCANPTIDQLILMIHNEVKRLEQVAYISNNSQPCKPKPPPPPKAPPPPKPQLPKIPPINGVLSETAPPGTATALPAAVTPSDQSFKGPKKVPCRFCGPTSTHNTFQCELSIQDRISAVKSKQLCSNCLKGGQCYCSVFNAVQMFSLSATPSHYTSWSFRSSVTTDFPSCISQYACCTCFRKHTAW
ncbi:hypothetical protein ACROYT_G017084 [Oculina patagonica]